MIRSTAVVTLLVGVPLAANAQAPLAKQRQTADAVVKSLQLSAVGSAEGKHVLIHGTLPDAKVKALAATLDKQFGIATKALQFEKDDSPWPGKLTVYVFTDRSDFRSFVRQVEKRSPDEDDPGSVQIGGDTPHISASSGRGRDATTVETQAGYKLAAALLAARARNVPLPEWVVSGFGRATVAQSAGQSAGVRKRAARGLVTRIKAVDTWNDQVPAEARQVLAGAVMDFLVYGKGSAKPADFLNGFRPDDERPLKSPSDALAAIKLTPEQFEVAFRRWLATNQ